MPNEGQPLWAKMIYLYIYNFESYNDMFLHFFFGKHRKHNLSWIRWHKNICWVTGAVCMQLEQLQRSPWLNLYPIFKSRREAKTAFSHDPARTLKFERTLKYPAHPLILRRSIHFSFSSWCLLPSLSTHRSSRKTRTPPDMPERLRPWLLPLLATPLLGNAPHISGRSHI